MRLPAKTKKWIFRSLLIAGIVFIVIVAAAVTVLFTQQQRLTNMAVAELNKQFKGELAIEKSNIALFKNFPNVSIALHGVRFFPNKTQTGRPLYKVDHLYVGFSLPDVLRQKYNVRRLFLKGGYLELVREKNGELNLAQAKNIRQDKAAAPADTSGSGFEIDLRKVVVRDLALSFSDKITGQKISTSIAKLTSSFKTDSSLLAITLDSDMELDITSPADTVLFRHKHVELDLGATYQKKDRFLRLTAGGFKLQDAAFNVEGTASFAGQHHVDLKVSGDKPDVDLLAAFIPGDVATVLEPFRYDGRIYFNGTVKGPVGKGQLPLIEVSFGCEDAWFLNTGADRKVDQLGFRGFYTNGSEHSLRTSELHMTNVKARPGKGVFEGNFVVRDFTDPHVLMQLRSELELQFIGEFLGIPDLRHITGTVKLNMDFKELADLDMPEQFVSKLKEGIQSELTVEDLSFRIPGYPHPVQDMNLHAEMKNGRVTLDTLRLRAGNSDLRMNGSISDLAALLHAHNKPVSLSLNISSNKLVLKELFAYDTALASKMEEEIKNFHIGMSLATTVQQLRSPAPLPKGAFELKQLRASFKKYPHAFHDLGAKLLITDTSLLLRNFAGMIDGSDLRLSGRVLNYQLWFQPFKKGKTQLAFDFKSTRFAMDDLLGPVSRTYVPPGYQQEEAANVWLRARADLRYDTTFKFAKVHIANISGSLKKHGVQLENISGSLLYGANKILKVDTLKGSIGRSDFNISMRLFNGRDKQMKKRTNYFYFRSRFLDIDQLGGYSFAPEPSPAAPPVAKTAKAAPDSSAHAKSFNIFTIPFTDFEVKTDIGRFKYNRLWLQGLTAHLRMQEDHYIYVDTLGVKVAGGAIGIKGYLNGNNPDKIYFRSRINVDDVDLEKMMIRLGHFGQDLVINKNIKGRLSGHIRSHVQVHPNLVPLMNDSKAELDVEIRNGSLVDFAPMQAMAGYFKDKNLRLVRFDTLRNVLTFTNGVLNIPAMNINSSLGFMEISGKQSLDMNMEYYMRVPMKMVTQVGFQALFGKKQSEVDMDQVDEIEYRDKDKKTRFMSIKVTGTPDKYKVGLGKEKGRS
ncbi:AsmA-like C-terminal region-containing protein [Chitinophaga alhagiae]|uniref:AsmA-like C-terminal region-containing protein n=1 Tax=Chitinophaga alhagiae TaxID=2203219 RepID=UPI001E59E916|nr:AsmA-like C-terminal region-containing protein [Chitinophaga alhagiae]